MAFSITRRLQNDWELVELQDDRQFIQVEIVPEAGAILNAFTILSDGNPLNIIDGYSGKADFQANRHGGFKSAKLSPFVCRLKNGDYQWEGKNYHIRKFMLHSDALHGLLYDAAFRVISTSVGEESCQVDLAYDYPGDIPGYPFPYTCDVKYSLQAGKILTISTRIRNPEGSSVIPISDGWHPYFRLGSKVDDWWLHVASDQMLEYDASLIPTGKMVTNPDFLKGRLIGDIKLDNGFLLNKSSSPFCVLKNPGRNITVEFISEKNYPYLQLYIPDHRESIAIENLSSAPDAFNNGMGLTIVKPGESCVFEVSIVIQNELKH